MPVRLAELCGVHKQHLASFIDFGQARYGHPRNSSEYHIYYRIADESIYALCDLVCGNLAKRLAEQANLLGNLSGKKKKR